MKKSCRLFFAVLLVTLAVPFIAWHVGSAQDNVPATPSQAPASKEKIEKFYRAAKPVRDQYIVVLKNDIRGEDVESVTNELLSRHRGTTRHIYTHAIKGFSIQMPEAAAIALSREPHVEYVEEDGLVTHDTTQSGANWGLDRIDQRTGLNGNYTFANVNMGTGVQAYVIDSGIQAAHSEFRNSSGVSRVRNDVDTTGGNFNDCNGHGTFVAGMLGGNTFGVARGATLHNVRISGCDDSTWSSNIIAGLNWVAGNHVKPAVANLSWGGGIDYGLEDAVRGLIRAGVTLVVAAGNDNRDAKDQSPARVSEAITVGASTSWDARAAFSNFGPLVDLFAPGDGVRSTSHLDDNGNGILDDSRLGSGTSYAAPMVAGVAARLLQVHPGASPAAVQGAIRNSATPDVVGDRGTGSPNLLLYSEIHAALAREASIAAINESDTRVDSGLDVGPDEWLALTGGGEIWAGVWFTFNNGPQGWNSIENNATFPLPGSRPFALLGTLDSQNFYIGNSNATADRFTTPKRLFLRTNDDVPGNGNGAFNCQAQVWKKLPDVSANFIAQSVPNIMLPGQTYSVSITMQNVGPTTWTAGQSYRLGPQPDNALWGTPRVTVPHDVPPNGTVTFNFNVTAPATPGNYGFQWRMLQEGVQWFGDVTDKIAVTVLAPSNQAEFVWQDVPRIMVSFESYDVSITMRNTGSTTWTAGTNYRLGSQNPQDNIRWGLARVELPHSVPPGGEVTFTFTVTPPRTIGNYNFQWRMVQDGVAWFGSYTPNLLISVRRFCADC